jgi:alpha-galactosidase
MSQGMGDSPVLILEWCLGNHSLGWDLLPPGLPEYEQDGYVIEGSGNSPKQWEVGKTANPKPVKQHARNQYETDVANVQHALENLKDFYPGITHGKYEIAGFVWRQGHRNLHFPGRYTAVEKILSSSFIVSDGILTPHMQNLPLPQSVDIT